MDHLIRILADNSNVRAVACDATAVVAEAVSRHSTSTVAGAALGRALVGGLLMGALLKDSQRVTLRYEGNGPLKKILVEADAYGGVRGYAGEPAAELPLKNGKLDVAGALGKAGFLTVIKDLGLKEPYQGMVQLMSSEIGEDLAYYLAESEQIPSAVGIGVFMEADGQVTSAGGFLIQAMPPGDPELIDTLVRRIGEMPPFSEQLRAGKTPEEILAQLFNGIAFHTVAEARPTFRCSCDRIKMEAALVSLGRNELQGLIHEQGEAEAHCQYCGERYQFTRQELERLLASATDNTMNTL